MKNDMLVNKLNVLIEPIVIEKGYELYHIEFVKEGGENYLRVYIDKEAGITLEDCEKVSRAVSDMLDMEDPISEGYYLEVSSPGIFRTLYNDKHYAKYVNSDILVKLNALLEGKRQLEGKLLNFNEDEITIEVDGTEISVPRNKIKITNLNGDL